jgi:hypothetical protein
MRAQLDLAADGMPLLRELKPEVANRAFGLSWRPDRFGGSRTSFEWGLDALLDGFGERGLSTGGGNGRRRKSPSDP